MLIYIHAKLLLTDCLLGSVIQMGSSMRWKQETRNAETTERNINISNKDKEEDDVDGEEDQ